MSDDFWGEPISRYTDQDALDDGTIVDISSLNLLFQGVPVNRMTRTLWEDLMPFAKAEAALYEGSETRALAQMMATKMHMAVYQGGIWQLPPNIWLIENEASGWTAMYPEDY